MSGDPLWGELLELEERKWARLDPKFGTCPICGLTASDVFRVDPIAWGVCFTCEQRWPAGAHLLDELEDENVQQLHMEILATFRDDTGIRHTRGVTMSKEKNTTATSVFTPLTNYALRAAEDRQQREREQRPVEPTPPTAAELAAWRDTSRHEDDAQQIRRASLVRWFANCPSFYFPLGGAWLPGPECAARLRAGAPFREYYCVQSRGMRRSPASWR